MDQHTLDGLLPECKTLMLVYHVLLSTHVHDNQIMSILVVLLVPNNKLFDTTYAVSVDCYNDILNLVVIPPGDEKLIVGGIRYLDFKQVESHLIIEHVRHDMEALCLFIED